MPSQTSGRWGKTITGAFGTMETAGRLPKQSDRFRQATRRLRFDNNAFDDDDDEFPLEKFQREFEVFLR